MAQHSDVAPPGPPATRRPAGLCAGRGHLLVYVNPAFRAAFGRATLGLPAREALLDLPPAAFALLDAVFVSGRPAAKWLRLGGTRWRMTAAPRIDPGTQEVYGVAFHLRAASDLPVLVPLPPPDR